MVGTCKPWLKQHHRQGCMYMWISSRLCLLLLLFPCMSPINMRYFCFTILDATGGAAVHYWKENGTPTPQKYFLDMELCDTAVLVVINLLTRGMGLSLLLWELLDLLLAHLKKDIKKGENNQLWSLPYLIIVADAADAVSVNFSGRCKFLQI